MTNVLDKFGAWAQYQETWPFPLPGGEYRDADDHDDLVVVKDADAIFCHPDTADLRVYSEANDQRFTLSYTPLDPDDQRWTFPLDVEVQFDAGGRIATATIPAGVYVPEFADGKTILRRIEG